MGDREGTNTLGVARTERVVEVGRRHWALKGLLPRREWVTAETQVEEEWTVDGVLLRTILTAAMPEVGWDEELFASPLSPSGDPRDAVAALEVLMGHRPAQCDDERVALMVCSSDFDSSCRALTAQLTITDDQVVWSSIREQVDVSDWRGEAARVTFRFERRAYEQTLGGVLARYGAVLATWESE